MGAIASLVDEIGAAVIHEEGKPMDVSVNMSISYVSDARINVSPTLPAFNIVLLIDLFELPSAQLLVSDDFIC